MQFGLRFEVGDIDIAVGVGRNDDDFETGHDGTGRICSVRRRRDQDDVTPDVAARAVIGMDHHQARQFPLCAGVRLKGNGGKARNFGERLLQLADDLRIALRLFDWNERMDG